ncbi:MAG: hypothetical protein GY856_39370 [bacterium]|nr:hypothetical protein [bacterium]
MRRSRPTAVLLTMLVSLAAGQVAAESSLELFLDLESAAVVISSLEPGAEVVYFDLYRFSAGYVPRTEHRATIVDDDDGDGIVEVELARELPGKFLAVAVELESGRFGVFRPEGSPGREVAFPAHSLQEGPGDRLDRLESTGPYLELLLVRPGTGAWQLTTGDGTPTDESPSSDGVVLNALEMMRPVGDSPPPPEDFATGDVLVRVKPAPMEYYAVRLVR